MTDEEKRAAEEAAKKAAEDEAAKKAEEDAKKAAEEEAARKAKESDSDEDKPTEAEAKLLKEVMKWKEAAKALESEKTQAQKEAEEKLKAYDGIDPEVARKALADAKERERKALESKGEYDRVVAQITEEHQKQLEAVSKESSDKDAEIAALKDTVNKLTVGTSFGNSQFIADKLVLSPAKTQQLYGDHFDVVDGKMVPYDKPRGAAERTPLVGSDGKPLTFEAAIEKIVSADPDFERMQKSKLKPGAGSQQADTKKTGDQQQTEATGFERIRLSLGSSKQ
tara:strand:+ start:117 stop:959 length:843 start_codon:yes stop_codon:yes gene_type:complete